MFKIYKKEPTYTIWDIGSDPYLIRVAWCSMILSIFALFIIHIIAKGFVEHPIIASISTAVGLIMICGGVMDMRDDKDKELDMLTDAYSQKSIINNIPRYKGFILRTISVQYSVQSASKEYICSVKKDGYMEYIRDEHGRPTKEIYHQPIRFNFAIEDREFFIADYDIQAVINNRFRAEVDYYLAHNANNPTDDFISKTFSIVKYSKDSRKYHCNHCGTEYYTSKEGFTPKCENCGALMKEIEGR